MKDCDLPDFTQANLASLVTASGTVTHAGHSRNSSGWSTPDSPLVPTSAVVMPTATGLSTGIMVAGDANALYLWRIDCNGQSINAGQVGVTNIGSADGVALGVRVLLFADDGTKGKPVLGQEALYDSGLITLGSTGNRSAGSASAVQMPVGVAWIGTVAHWTTPPGTFPTLVTISNPLFGSKGIPPTGVISSGTTAGQARVWKQASFLTSSTTLTAPTQDQSAHAAPALVVA
jgi:hypothetical protein